MQTGTVFLLLLAVGLLGFAAGRSRARAVARGAGGLHTLHSLPVHYGTLVASWALLPGMVALLCWFLFEPGGLRALMLMDLPAEVRAMPPAEFGLYYSQILGVARGGMDTGMADAVQLAAAGQYSELAGTAALWRAVTVLGLAVLGGLLAYVRIQPRLRARPEVEGLTRWLLFGCAFIAVLTTLGIVLSVLFEALRFFQAIPVSQFLFGLEWSPQIAIRADQIATTGAFGFVPLLAGTLLISAVAMLIAVPVGLMSAVYLAEYASSGFRAIAKPVLEVLAGIPTVVYGFFAALTVAPAVRQLGEAVGLAVASESALAAGLVMGIMITPFVMSLSDDIICAVPDSLREASLGMGATHSETICRVIFPAALPGIVGGILLAVSRAIGETMIVVMAAGLAARLTANPLEAVTTITVQIVTLLVGDQEFDSPKTLAAFALGLILFLVTLLLNVIALYVVRRYREQYE